jgi:hypothetical protein
MQNINFSETVRIMKKSSRTLHFLRNVPNVIETALSLLGEKFVNVAGCTGGRILPPDRALIL